MSDSEQEKYSIDEMMNRLRSRGEGGKDGEPQLVTREDGTQVMRVRKRKRRSKQPHKEAEAKRRKQSLIVAALVTVLLLAVGLGLLAWVFYLNSGSYRGGIEQKISTWTGAEVKMAQFRATPISIGAGRLEMTWPEDQPAARLILNGVQGDVNMASYFGTELRGEQIVARNGGELVLRAASPKSGGRSERPAETCPFDFSYRSNRFNIKFGDGPRPVLTLSNSEASYLVPDTSKPAGNFVLQGGQARVGNWGTYLLEFASLQILQEEVRVGNIELVPEGSPDAQIRLRGDGLPPVLTRGGVSELRYELKKMPSTALLGPGLGKIVDATFETPERERNTARCFVDVTDLDSLRVEAPVQVTLSSVLSLHYLELFTVLASETGDSRLAQARFETEARAVFKRSSEEIRLEQLSLVSQSLVRVSGYLAEKGNGTLEGILEIGLPESTVLGAASRALPEVFKRRSSGHRWARVKVSGTAEKPADDLADQLQTALLGISPAAGGAEGLEDEFLDLTTPR